MSSPVELLAVMRQLRVECDWKRAQTHRSLARYLLEETHETLEAIDTGDADHLREELGDLLLQVYFHAVIAEENGDFTFEDVAADIVTKLRRRNPHVFGSASASGPVAVNELWESIKATEKQRDSVTDGLPPGLPALLYADKVLSRLSRSAPAPAPPADSDRPRRPAPRPGRRGPGGRRRPRAGAARRRAPAAHPGLNGPRMASLGPDFRWLWSGNAAGNLADGVAFVGIPLVATSITTNPSLIAGLALAYSGARTLLVVPVGVVVDRVDRRLLMWLPNVLRGMTLLALALAFAAGIESLLLLYITFTLVGVMEIAADNAAVSVLPDLVAPDDLDRANGRIATAQLVADEFVGPPLGGFLFALAVAAPLAATGGLYAAAGLLFLALPRQPRPGPTEDAAVERPSMWRDAAAGAAWIRSQQLLLGLAITGGLASVAYMMTFSIIVLYATETLGASPTGYGVILAVSSLGGLLASSSTAKMRQAVGYVVLVPGALALGAITMLGLYFTTSPLVAAPLLAAYIFHATVWNICVVSLRQRLVPSEMRGRQNSLFKLFGLVGLVVGAAIAGPIASIAGLATPFGIAGLIFVGCAGYTAWLLKAEPQTAPPRDAVVDT